jgi:hypothetical protein
VTLTPDASRTAFTLLADARSVGLQSRETEVIVAAGAVLHGLEGSQRLLLIPLADGEVATLDDESRGVVLRSRDLVDAGATRRFQTITCELPELNSAFETFCDEVLQALDDQPEAPAQRCLDVLGRWRDLLGPRSSNMLGRNALSGLLAELHMLERIAAASDPHTCLALWTGPGGSRFDFMGHASAVEVKATTSRDTFTVGIHGLLQLDPPSGTKLHLYAEQMELVPVDGDSVPDALDRLAATGVPRQALLSTVALLGILPVDLESYRAVRFRTLAVRAFLVERGFPRLVASELADASMADRVIKVSYTIDLSDVAAVPGHIDDPDHLAQQLVQP